MAEEADGILHDHALGLSDEDKEVQHTRYQTIPRLTLLAKKLYLRTKKLICVDILVQKEGEPVDSFITSLYRQAEHSHQRDLHGGMIGDRIFVSLPDSNLSERLQTNPELTLDKAITMARQTKAVREQQAVVRGETDSTCTRIEAVEQLLQQKTTNYFPSQQA